MTAEQINQIADQLDAGFKCYVSKEDGSLIFIPDENKYPDMDLETWEEDINQIESNPTGYIEIEPMDTRAAFRVMEAFIDTVDDGSIQNRLADSLRRPKPFQNFKFDIDRSGDYRQKWFDFKKARIVDWVRDHLQTPGAGL